MAGIVTYREPVVNTYRERQKSQAVDNGGMDFAANLRAIRELRGMTQGQLAAACGWDNPTRVTNYESRSTDPRNRRYPSVADIPAIARALGVPVALLFSETPPESLDNKSDLRSNPVRLDPAILRTANIVLAAGLADKGAPLEVDLDRDAELISLVYAWAMDRSNSDAYAAMQEAIATRATQGDGDAPGRNEPAAGRSRRARKG